MKKFIPLLLLIPSLSWGQTLSHGQAQDIVKNFLIWSNVHYEEIIELDPEVTRVIDHQFVLEKEKVPLLISKLESSHLFSSHFKQHVHDYYVDVAKKLASIPKQQVINQEKYGFQTRFDFQEMDVPFCSQDSKSEISIVENILVSELKNRNGSATAYIETQNGWKTTFTFIHEKGQWKIKRYCHF